jgi:hypothetical protein
MTEFESRVLTLLTAIDNRLGRIERALAPSMYKVGEDGVLTRITDGGQVIPTRGPR